MQNRTVLVTGATGFIGSRLASALRLKGANVVALVRDIPAGFSSPNHQGKHDYTVVIGALENYPLIERILNEYDVDTCFHLGAQAIVGVANKNPLSTFESNIVGTWNILEACRRGESVKRVIVASSDKAYGEPKVVPITEDHPLLARYPYDASKACADILARTYYQTYGLPVSVTRFSNVYGEGDLNFSRIIPDTIRSALSGQEPIIRSDGTPIRDYIYASDAVDGFISLASHLERPEVRGQAFNFGTGKPTNVLELVSKILALSGKKHLRPKVMGKASGEISKQYLSPEKAKQILGWSAKTALEEGLQKTIAWYEANKSLWQGGRA
jgi:CDP-glucose 4,6-dehydratase